MDQLLWNCSLVSAKSLGLLPSLSSCTPNSPYIHIDLPEAPSEALAAPSLWVLTGCSDPIPSCLHLPLSLPWFTSRGLKEGQKMIKAMLRLYLLCAKHCSTHYILHLILHNNPMTQQQPAPCLTEEKKQKESAVTGMGSLVRG